MTRYSTCFEFNDARNSRKSLLRGIRIAQVAEIDNDLEAFLRRQLCVERRVRSIRILEAVENPKDFLHTSIVYVEVCLSAE